MSERAPYSRVYWTVVDDLKFREVYDDDRALACWLRLLIVADQAWPASAPLPASARRVPVALLVRVGLVDLQSGGRYRIHGLDAERGTRRLSATRNRLGQDPDDGTTGAPVANHPGPNRDPDGLSTPGRSRAEPSRATPSRDDARETDDHRADLEAWLGVRFRVPTEGQRRFLDMYCRIFDLTGPERAARLIWANPGDPIAALKVDLDAFRGERAAEAKAAETPKPTPHRKASAMTGINAELAKLLHAEYGTDGGAKA